SVVWLNAGSHIRYAANFVQNTRTVYLQGEAYFDIKHDAVHPFIVHAGNIEIKVLGTEFNVQAYADENKIETTLITGKIQVQIAGNPDKKIILTHHEKLTVINQDFKLGGMNGQQPKETSFQVKEIPLAKTGTPLTEIEWMQDKLAFQNEPMQELSKQLDRRFNVHILFQDTLLEQEKLTGVFVNENIQKALKILQMTTPFRYRIVNDTVYLRSEK
ncbi:MAG: FecR family protein, partial [Chitinophagaceae bacterium]